MKKALLSLAACAMLASSADAKIYLVGDPAGVWSPQTGIEMTETDGGYKWTGSVGSDQWFAFATQLLDSDDWDLFNSTYRLNPTANGTVAADGEYTLELGGKDRAFKGNGSEVTYFIKESDGVYTLTVSGAGEAPEPEPQTWGLIGAFNGWAEDFPMTQIRDGVWKATMYDFSGEFKFRANGDWNVNLGAAEDYLALIEGDGDYRVAQDGFNFNIPEEVEEVIFELDVNNGYLNVSGLSPKMLALRGDFNDWNYEEGYFFSEWPGGMYVLEVDKFDAGCEFKIADQDWFEEYSTGVLDMEAGELYDLLPGYGVSNMGVKKAYSGIMVMFSLEDGYFVFYGEEVEDPSAVEAAGVSAAPARYFNLQGVEVKQPAKGIYLRVRDGRTEKVTLK